MDAFPTKEMLPPGLARIARVVGVEAALRIAEAEGGRYCAFPEADQVDDDHWLAALIGLKPARKLCDALADPDGEIVSLRIERADGVAAPGDWMEALPPFLARVAALVGNDAALKVMEKQGGGRCYLPVPEGLHGDHWLSQLIGYPSAVRVCREIGAGALDVPAGLKSERMSRRQPGGHPIDKHLMAGLSISQSAVAAGSSRATARRRRVFLRENGVELPPRSPTIRPRKPVVPAGEHPADALLLLGVPVPRCAARAQCTINAVNTRKKLLRTEGLLP